MAEQFEVGEPVVVFMGRNCAVGSIHCMYREGPILLAHVTFGDRDDFSECHIDVRYMMSLKDARARGHTFLHDPGAA